MQQRSALPELGADVSPLTLNVENIDSTTLRVKLGAPGRWEVPRALLRGTVDSAPPCPHFPAVGFLLLLFVRVKGCGARCCVRVLPMSLLSGVWARMPAKRCVPAAAHRGTLELSVDSPV